ncbi:deoxyribonuclease II family protein, partial [Trichinella spiralis]
MHSILHMPAIPNFKYSETC